MHSKIQSFSEYLKLLKGGENDINDNSDNKNKKTRNLVISLIVLVLVICFSIYCCISSLMLGSGSSSSATPAAEIPDMTTPTDTSAYETDTSVNEDQGEDEGLFDSIDLSEESEGPSGSSKQQPKKK